MPEGHSLLRAARMWETTMRGFPLHISSPQGRFAEEAKLLDGLKLEKAWSHGKHLFLDFERDQTVHIHLALYGKHHVYLESSPEAKGAIRLRASTPRRTVDLVGPAVCELLSPTGVQAVLNRLGPDPLKLEAPPQLFLERMAKLEKPIGQVLMEQSLIAGIGNVYRAEVLFQRALDPYGSTAKLSEDEWRELWSVTRGLMFPGAELQGPTITILKNGPRPIQLPDSVDPTSAGDRRAYAYNQTGKPCLACGTKIARKDFYGRRLYWCPGCQLR